MARPVVHIKTPPPTHEEMIRHLRIPKARQKQLLAIVAETRQRLAARRGPRRLKATQQGEQQASACAAS